MLARLLATEDLVVEHKKVETACFNVHTRVLTLPMWKKASNIVYDMLVAHEVSHALYTPNEDWTEKVNIPHQFVNVVEDARVEKLIKRRYMGLGKTFYGAYKELNDEDFFMVLNEDISKMNLADRVNLYFKVGNFLSISFNEKEMEIIDMISNVETFGDTLLAAEILYKYCVEEEKEDLNDTSKVNIQIGSNSSDNGFEKEQFENDTADNGENVSENSNTGEVEEQKNLTDHSGGKFNEPEVKTMSSLEESIKELAKNPGLSENIYLEIPEVNLDSVIISNKQIHNECNDNWSHYDGETFNTVDLDFNKFKQSTQKEVNYLVKEFECRKSADSYARATTSRTGILDTTKLHTYRHNEDLFKKITTLAEGKNHGLVFILDWSGSMSEVMKDTIKQLYNLIWFCRKVSIPFEVYAFTNSYGPIIQRDEYGKPLPPVEHTFKKENQFVIDYCFNLMNIFTSKVRSSELENQMKSIYRLVNCFGNNSYCCYSIPHRMQLSGTPLNEALITLHKILPKFQNENKLQKVQCVVLTDGEAGPLNYYRPYKRDWMNSEQMGTAYVNDNCYLRDRKTGNVYSMKLKGNPYVSFTNVILENLRDKFSSVNFIGMRILENYSAVGFIREYTNYAANSEDYIKVHNRWKKERSFVLTNAGYHKYFGISANALNKNSEFEVKEDASKTEIRSAFAKSLGVKKMNKKILNEFVELIV